MCRVEKGNFYCDRTNPSSIIAGCDIRITGDDEKVLTYRYRFAGTETFTSVPNNELVNPFESSWEDVPLFIREEYFNEVFDGKDIDEETRILFIYGPKKGNEILNDKWSDTHIIHSKELTLKLINQIGRFNVCKLSRNSIADDGTYYYVYNIDDKYQLTLIVKKSSFKYELEDLVAAREKRASFGKNLRILTNKYHLPKEIALMIAKVEKEEDLDKFANLIQNSASKISGEQKEKLIHGGRKEKIYILNSLFGKEFMNRYVGYSEKKINALSAYLAGVSN